LPASEPLAVNTISSGSAPSSDATCSRAPSIASRARSPRTWTEDAFPKRSPKNGVIAASTSGAIGVVAAWSA
jgi:hypothetical protein